MPYKPKADPEDYNDPPYDPERFARLQWEYINQHFPQLFITVGNMSDKKYGNMSYEELTSEKEGLKDDKL